MKPIQYISNVINTINGNKKPITKRKAIPNTKISSAEKSLKEINITINNIG